LRESSAAHRRTFARPAPTREATWRASYSFASRRPIASSWAANAFPITSWPPTSMC